MLLTQKDLEDFTDHCWYFWRMQKFATMERSRFEIDYKPFCYLFKTHVI